jgi:hypothetical protein
VELAGLEPAAKRLCLAMDEPLRGHTASMRESQHLMLTLPRDRRLEQAGDTDSARQPTIDSGLDEAWRQKGKRDRHMNVALAAGLTCGDGVDRRGAGLDLGEPVSCARIAVTSLTRVLERIGRASAWDAPSGTMTSRWRSSCSTAR